MLLNRVVLQHFIINQSSQYSWHIFHFPLELSSVRIWFALSRVLDVSSRVHAHTRTPSSGRWESNEEQWCVVTCVRDRFLVYLFVCSRSHFGYWHRAPNAYKHITSHIEIGHCLWLVDRQQQQQPTHERNEEHVKWKCRIRYVIDK